MWGVSVRVAVHGRDHHFSTMHIAHAIRIGRTIISGRVYPKRGADYP